MNASGRHSDLPLCGTFMDDMAPPAKPGRTELVFILDRSGSMAGLESDTIGGYNAMLRRQQAEQGDATVTTILFSDAYELLHDRIDIHAVHPITEKEYCVGGCTALLDAIGHAIGKLVNVQRHTDAAHRADKVLFVITTDGLENASREFTIQQVRSLVERQKIEYNWEFLFLGANIDAISTAEKIGIHPSRAVNYHADARGLAVNYETLSDTVSSFRECGCVAEDWKSAIETDHEARSHAPKRYGARKA